MIVSNEAHTHQSESIDLTESQMRIWSGQMLEPDKPLYNMVFSFEIEGSLDIEVFKRAFQRLVDEHDVLRLTIAIEGEIPKQRFLPELESPLELHDLSNNQSPEEDLATWIKHQKKKLFNTGQVLYHTALIKLNDQKYVWYLNQHHLITDGWSLTVLYQAMSRHYGALMETGQSDRTEAIAGYRSHAESNSFFQQENTSAYWQEKKEAITSSPALYGNRNRQNTSNSQRISVNLGKVRTRQLRALCQDPDIRAWTEDMALNNIFLTLTNALIYKVSGQSKFAVGMPSHNRLTPVAKTTAGLFMELMPVSAGVSGADSFIALYQKCRDEYFEVLKNIGKHKPPVECLRSFNALLNFIPQQFGDFAGHTTTADWIHSDHHDAGHHLRLQIHDFNRQDDYLLHFDLNHEVFSAQKGEAVVQHFIRLLDLFIADKQKTLQETEIISDAEIALIDGWNDSDEPMPAGETLLTAFEQQAERTPDHVALVFGENSLTYRQFNEKANQLAHYLKSQGISPGDVVGVQVERSFELMWCLYGLLKAGAIYLPIDVSSPPERTRFLIGDAQVKLLFTSNISGEHQCKTVRQNELDELINKLPVAQPPRNTRPEDTAYIIYTSGSTGKPKGVICHHKGICNKLRWRNGFYPLSQTDAVLQKTSITFDISLWELFWPLQVGARLVMAPPNAHKDSAQLIELIKEHTITTLHLVPSMLNVFLAETNVTDCSSLRHVFCVGEALHKTTVEKFHGTLDCKLYNMYGPTEAALEVTYWDCKKNEPTDTVPIGFTTPNTRLYVLGERLNRVPIGTPGELFIAGAQVAHGYLNDEELTAGRFLSDPYWPEADYKMYKTGDLARYLENGALEYLGRTDYQIKLRGFRVELGEIEVAMMKHPDIEQAVVTKVDQSNSGAYLVGYYTGNLVEENQLGSLLSQYVPDYMIPSFFVHLEKFKLSTSGKVDRKKLPIHNVGEQKTQSNYQPAETRLQEMIAEVWEEILQVKEPGIYDKFTDLGGDSLKALVITSRIKEMLDLELSVHLIFKHSDISSYADYLEKLMVAIMSQEED